MKVDASSTSPRTFRNGKVNFKQAMSYPHLTPAHALLLREGTVFALPGIVVRVAQECSGIRSSWVLFITSILSANLFLRTNWKRVVLVALVIPLGILRNGFRVWVIGMLCVRFGPHMIDSPIHHQGGPLFFILSLVPLFILIVFLRRSEDEAVDRLAGGVGHNA